MPTRKAKDTEAHVHLMLPRDLWKRVRLRAVEKGTTAVALVEEALTEYLRRRGGKS